jgi:hypothetical protein
MGAGQRIEHVDDDRTDHIQRQPTIGAGPTAPGERGAVDELHHQIGHVAVEVVGVHPRNPRMGQPHGRLGLPPKVDGAVREQGVGIRAEHLHGDVLFQDQIAGPVDGPGSAPTKALNKLVAAREDASRAHRTRLGLGGGFGGRGLKRVS